MRKIMRKTLIALATCLVIATTSFAQTRPSANRGQGPGGGRMMQNRMEQLREIVKSLGLSDEQKTKVNEILDKAKQEMQAKMEDMDKNGTEMRERMQAGQQIFQELRGKIEEVLSEDQRKTFE